MRVETFVEEIKSLGITTIAGVPDSALQPFCNYLNGEKHGFSHFVPANEGAAVGIAIGTYLSTGKPACVYMQNSGIGNIVNPVTSLANEAVYDIPMLFIIGWRGEPGKKDEPQHRFMGEITRDILEVLQIPNAVLSADMTEKETDKIFKAAGDALLRNKQYAIIVKRDALETDGANSYQNAFTLCREDAISEIIKSVSAEDIIVSTTGKISREVYEQCDKIVGHHKQAFLTVGGMGHAGMIAFGIAQQSKDKKIYCIEGDGAVLMHMGELAFLAKQQPENFVHICLNNDAHESVGGMPTGAVGKDFFRTAKDCGYSYAVCVEDLRGLQTELKEIKEMKGPVFLEVKVKIGARKDLGRPKESAVENRNHFMRYHFPEIAD